MLFRTCTYDLGPQSEFRLAVEMTGMWKWRKWMEMGNAAPLLRRMVGMDSVVKYFRKDAEFEAARQ